MSIFKKIEIEEFMELFAKEFSKYGVLKIYYYLENLSEEGIKFDPVGIKKKFSEYTPEELIRECEQYIQTSGCSHCNNKSRPNAPDFICEKCKRSNKEDFLKEITDHLEWITTVLKLNNGNYIIKDL